MVRYSSYAALILLCLGCTVTAVAATPDPALQSFPSSDWGAVERSFLKKRTKFVPAGWRRRISLPSPPGPEKTKLEIAELLALMAIRVDRADEIRRQVDGAESEFLAVIPKLAELDERLVKSLVAETAYEAAIVIFYFKHKFSRVRPWTLAPQLVPIVPRPPQPAYPSGHATQGRLVALVLAYVLPTCRKRVTELGRRIGTNREIAGVHYKSDTTAGVGLAEQIFRLLMASPAYSRTIHLARKRLAGVICRN